MADREEYIPLASISREWFEDEFMEMEVSDSVWNMVIETVSEEVENALTSALGEVADRIRDGQFE